ncbi:MAG: alpha/beta fold hydrolase [Actinomycetota bacterium]
MPLELIGGLFAERFGGAAPVLALHGWGRDRRDWAGVLAAAGGLAPDLPGFGATPAPAEAVGAAGYAALVEPALQVFGGPVVVVGHSFGGRVAVHLALRRPEAVAALVLAGVPLVRLPGARPRVSPRYRSLRLARRLRLVPEHTLEQARRRFGSGDYRAASGVMRQVLVRVVEESYEEQLCALACPVHLVWGEEDRVVPPAVATRALTLIGAGRLTLLAGVGHDVPAQAPEALAAAIGEHLPGPAGGLE